MGDHKGTAGVVCQVCGKSWPADTSICPTDGAWLHDETIMDERGRRMRAATKGDAFAPERNTDAMQAATVVELASKEPGELPPGTRVGEYDVEIKVGEGAMGTVYRAIHPAIGRHVAIKVMSPKLFEEPEAIKRFVAEARAVAAIRHPGIVDIFGFGRLPDDRTYLVMEWLEGATLGEQLKKQGRPAFDDACDMIRQIARALEAAHSKGIVHRDLKPDNVFIHHIDGEKPVTKVLDFGLAKVTNKEDGLVARTRTGQMLGTPLYMSPEQCKSKGVDHRTDIYALGCMAYELLCGRVPFDADNVAELISAHLMTEPPRPHTIEPRLAPELDALLFQMVAKDPEQRPSLAHTRRVISQSLNTPTTPRTLPAYDTTPAPFAVPPGVAPAPPATFAPVPDSAPYALRSVPGMPPPGTPMPVSPPMMTPIPPPQYPAPMHAPSNHPTMPIRRSRIPWVTVVVAVSMVTLGIALYVLFM